MKRSFLLIVCLVGITLIVAAQESTDHDMSGMQMPGHDMSKMQDHDMSADPDAGAHAMHSMEDRHMDMGPHMKMTTLREPQAGDQQKADRIVAAARKVADKYQDYKTALNDGFKIFLPNLPQKHYHFTNYQYGFEAAFSFNPEHPTSLPRTQSSACWDRSSPRKIVTPTAERSVPSSSTGWCTSIRSKKTPRKSGRLNGRRTITAGTSTQVAGLPPCQTARGCGGSE